MIIEIDGDPIPWQRARRNKNVYYDPQFIAKKNFAWIVKGQFTEKPLEHPLKVSFSFFFKMPDSWSKKKKSRMIGLPHIQKPDLSNLLKFSEDALNEIVWTDDRIISYESAKKRWADKSKTIIEIMVDDE